MSELINGRTPEEIKRWVDGRATCNTCPKEHEVGCEDGERTEDCQMTIDTIAYIERLESEREAALAKVPKWINVKERLPENFKTVIIMRDDVPNGGLANIGWRIGEHWSTPNGVKVTHWMPMPEQPKEE